MRLVFMAAAAFCIAAVALICVFLFMGGLPFFTKYNVVDFLTGTEWKPANEIFGILPMIVGTIYVTVGALIFGMLDNIMGLNGINSNIQLVVKGFLIILSVFAQAVHKED